MSISRRPAGAKGFTLIELIMFIVIVSIGLIGILSVFNIVVRNSADPMVHKRMLSIAEALMEEVSAQAFTYCDPTDANATTASSTTGCATTVQGLGPTSGQTRTSSTDPFNNVADYSGLASMSPVTDILGNNQTDTTYSATIAINDSDGLGAGGLAITPNDSTAANLNALRITVTVTHGSESLTLEGYRTRHSPNLVP